MRNLNKNEERELREIARFHGYVASSGPHAGDGSASQLIDAILSGEIATVLLSDEQRSAVINYIADYLDLITVHNYIAAEGLKSIREALMCARDRGDL